MRRHRNFAIRNPPVLFDYEERDEYRILSAPTPAALCKKVSKILAVSVPLESNGNAKGGQHGHLSGQLFFAKGNFHQVVVINHWQEVPHKLSELATRVEAALLEAGPEGLTAREVAAKLKEPIATITRAVRRELNVSTNVTSADRRYRVRSKA